MGNNGVSFTGDPTVTNCFTDDFEDGDSAG